MGTTTKFCTLEDVKAQVNMLAGWTEKDAELLAHVQQATALIREYTRRDWEHATRTQLFDSQSIQVAFGNGLNVARFIFAEKPLTAVNSVTYNTGGSFGTSDALEADDFMVDLERNRVLVYPKVMSYNAASIQINYDAGYQPDATDPDLLLVAPNLRMACAVQAAFTFKRVLNENSGNKQKSDKKGFGIVNLGSSGLITEAQALVRSEVRTFVGGHG